MEYFPFLEEVKFSPGDRDGLYNFSFYNPEQQIAGKNMSEHLRFSVALWHSFLDGGDDPFGEKTLVREWNEIGDDLQKAKLRIDAAFEFMDKLNIQYFCFHDMDLVPSSPNLKIFNDKFDRVAEYLQKKMSKHDKNLLWGTANLFQASYYRQGAATAANPDVFARAAAQVKKALEVTDDLEGDNFVIWGGREGYDSLLNTDMKLDLDNKARFLEMIVDYCKEIGFTGNLLIEPKPMEPRKHLYDFDAAHTHAFLENYGLKEHFKLNIEANHATLAGHNFAHELRYSRIHDMLGSVDANQGDKLLGWDTDEFTSDIYKATLACYELLENGGIAPGGLNFDAKLRRTSTNIEDLVIAHISAMDVYACGLKAAYNLQEDEVLQKFIEQKYEGYSQGIGQQIKQGQTSLEGLEDYVLNNELTKVESDRQELLEKRITEKIIETVQEGL